MITFFDELVGAVVAAVAIVFVLGAAAGIAAWEAGWFAVRYFAVHVTFQ